MSQPSPRPPARPGRPTAPGVAARRAWGPGLWLAVLLLSGVALGGAASARAGAVPFVPVAAVTGAVPFVPVAGPVFGDPTAARNEIIARLLDNVAHTPGGATIRIVGYSFSLGSVATALLAAHGRGVHVQVVVNGHSAQWSPAKRLLPVLGSDISRESFFVLTRRSARGTGGVTHQKSWTFSQVGQTPFVVMVGSTNLTGYGTEVQYSDTYVSTGREDLFDLYTRVFDVQKHDTPVADPYVSATLEHGGATFFPLPGGSAATDPALARIRALPGRRGTTIGVSQFAWYGDRGLWLAKALAEKRRAGALVEVVAGESVGAGVRSVLAGAGIPVHAGVYPQGKRIHTKLMLASYTDGSGPHTSIWTGSDNWSTESFANDDDVLRVDDDVPGYNRYVGFFNLLADPAAAGTRTGPLPAVVVPAPTTPVPTVPVPTTPVPTVPVPTVPVPVPVPTVPVPTVPVPTVRRDTTVTLSVSHSRVRRLGAVDAVGTVRTRHAGRTVLLQRYYYATSTWRTVARSAPLGASAAYSVRLPTGKVQAWRYRAVVAATATAKAGRSATVRVRVVR